MTRTMRGFTMVEMIITIAVGAILLSIALRGLGGTMSSLAVDNARQSFASLQAQARTYAIERGELTRLGVDPAGDTAWVQAAGGTRVSFLDFMEERGVDVQTSTAGIITLCMNPRGFADVDCNSFGANTVDVEFRQGGQSSTITILPLGQLSW
ncbi:MAG: Tfp pilus assembly protein FimT/FimU [Longimicrobiales bacterium]